LALRAESVKELYMCIIHLNGDNVKDFMVKTPKKT
jgi:hypothetical protein